jgi:hypothetical protein
MDFKKNLQFFVFVFPIAFVVGVLVSFIVSLQSEGDVEINWLIAVAAAIVMDILITWRNNRDAKRQKGDM